MVLSESERIAKDVNKVVAAAKSTGPKTEQGKIRSAINAVKHGLAGKNLLLPGEDAAEYEARLDGIFSAMAPQNDGEAELVALVADDIWKLGRLARIEKGVTLGRIEQLLAQTATAEKSGLTCKAISTLGVALETWSEHPIPIKKEDEFKRRFHAMSNAVEFVEATVPRIPAAISVACDELLSQLYGKKDEADVPADVYSAVFDTARELMTVLLDRGNAEEAAQEELRPAMASIALPDEAELRKLAKYRSMLETSLQRRMALLDQLRKLCPEAAAEGDAERAREFRVRLRVVA